LAFSVCLSRKEDRNNSTTKLWDKEGVGLIPGIGVLSRHIYFGGNFEFF
jgi:hypothetical protein